MDKGSAKGICCSAEGPHWTWGSTRDSVYIQIIPSPRADLIPICSVSCACYVSRPGSRYDFLTAVVLGFELTPREVRNVCILGILNILWYRALPSMLALDVRQKPNRNTQYPSPEGVQVNKQTINDLQLQSQEQD